MHRPFHPDVVSTRDSIIKPANDSLVATHFLDVQEFASGKYDSFVRALSHVLSFDIYTFEPLLRKCVTFKQMFATMLEKDEHLCHVPSSFECISASLCTGHPVLTLCSNSLVNQHAHEDTTRVPSALQTVLRLFFRQEPSTEESECTVPMVVYGFDSTCIHAMCFTDTSANQVTIPCDKIPLLGTSWCVIAEDIDE